MMGALNNPKAENRAFNIAGGEILTYREGKTHYHLPSCQRRLASRSGSSPAPLCSLSGF
jgi:hypothetical protein